MRMEICLLRVVFKIASAGDRELEAPSKIQLWDPYNGDLGAEPLAGFRGKAPGQGADTIWAFGRSLKAANLPIF